MVNLSYYTNYYSSKMSSRKLPRDFLKCPKNDLIILISRMLVSLISINDTLPANLSSDSLTRFHSRAPPNISIYEYLLRLSHYSSLENSMLLISIYYIDLLSNNYKNFNLNSLTVHRFLLTSTTIAAKGLCDYFCTNRHYAKVGGVNLNELNFLEMEFLERVGWRIIPKKRQDETIENNVGEWVRNQESRRSSQEIRGEDFREDWSTSSSSSSSVSGASAGAYASPTKKFMIPMGYANEVLDNYYKKMIDLVGMENININGKGDFDYTYELEPQKNQDDIKPSFETKTLAPPANGSEKKDMKARPAHRITEKIQLKFANSPLKRTSSVSIESDEEENRKRS